MQGHDALQKLRAVSGEEVVVIGHGWDDSDAERFVWRGTASEFHSEWGID
jgi:hypothetical protein